VFVDDPVSLMNRTKGSGQRIVLIYLVINITKVLFKHLPALCVVAEGSLVTSNTIIYTV